MDVVFEQFETNKERLHITDWAITNTTLEEVFLKIAHALGDHQEGGEEDPNKKKRIIVAPHENTNILQIKVEKKDEDSDGSEESKEEHDIGLK